MKQVMRQPLILMLMALLAAPGGVADPAPLRPLFADDAVIELSLAGPLSATFADRESRQPRLFSLRLGTTEVPVEVQVRGKSRARICTFAPLRLDFGPDGAAGTVFAGQDRLKLVLPCHDSDRAEGDVLEEYAAYRTFNLLSDLSFRVRLVRIRFIDTDRRDDDPLMERHAFLLEPDAELSARAGRPEARIAAVRRSELEANQAAIVFIFQYLVGNTDWSLVTAEGEEACCHNLRLFGAAPPLYAVPYDFDLAGLVNARYAKPDPSLNIQSVKRRRYRGYCIDSAALETALVRITTQRDAVLAASRSLPLFDKKQTEARERYLEGFFEQAEDAPRLLRQFEEQCL
jgi:hypothetical protein